MYAELMKLPINFVFKQIKIISDAADKKKKLFRFRNRYFTVLLSTSITKLITIILMKKIRIGYVITI